MELDTTIHITPFAVWILTSFFDYSPSFLERVGRIRKGIHYIYLHSKGDEHIFQRDRQTNLLPNASSIRRQHFTPIPEWQK
jgi:hypothetical protein